MNDIIVQFARLWSQKEQLAVTDKQELVALHLRQFASDEMLVILTEWAEEYQKSDADDTVEFFDKKIDELYLNLLEGKNG